MNEYNTETQTSNAPAGERAFAYRILRYTPNLVRDEWVNIGVVLFAPETGDRRLKLIEEQDELNRVRRLHPQVDESLLLRLRDDLEDRFQSANGKGTNGGDWQGYSPSGTTRFPEGESCVPDKTLEEQPSLRPPVPGASHRRSNVRS